MRAKYTINNGKKNNFISYDKDDFTEEVQNRIQMGQKVVQYVNKVQNRNVTYTVVME